MILQNGKYIEAGLICIHQENLLLIQLVAKQIEKIFFDQAENIKSYGAAVVVMAFDDSRTSSNTDQKKNLKFVKEHKFLQVHQKN